MISASGYDLQMISQLIARTPPIVFVIDDDISVRESLEFLIRHEGLAVETFRSPTNSVALIYIAK
jgi:FixJ family two-component response regulator